MDVEIPETTNWLSGAKWNISGHRTKEAIIEKSVTEKTEEACCNKSENKSKNKNKSEK